MANFLDSILNILNTNPKLISSILSLVFPNSSTNTQSTLTPPTPPPPSPPPTTPNYTPNNPYWSLPNYHYTPNSKPKYRDINQDYATYSTPNNQQPQPTTQQPKNTNTQTNTPKIDISQTITVLTNLISALRSQQPPTSSNTQSNTTYPPHPPTTHNNNTNSYIHNLHPTD